MRADVDIAVIGAGPVGLAAAIEARLAGLSVAVIEPRDGTIDKACGEGLMPGAVPLLARLGVHPAGMPLRGVSYRTGTARADHLFRSGAGLGVRRTVLHTALTARANELGVLRLADRVEEVEQSADAVEVAGLRARYAIASDGLHSTVRRLVGLDRPVRRGARRFGLRRHFAIEPWSDLIEVHWGEEAEVYVTPVSEYLVGIAVLGPPRTEFDGTVAAIAEVADHLHGAEPASGLRGAGPFRQRSAGRIAGRVLLVGDSSGYVDAITGEGLRLGFEQARVAVESIAHGRPADYPRAWRRVTRDFRMLTAGLVAAASGPLRPGIVPAARALPWLYGSVVERLAR